MNAPDCQLRALTPDDRAGIEGLAIGHDYILTSFDGWLQDSANTLALCLTSGEVLVSMEVAALVDGGTTVWLKALRVHNDYRRRGLAHRMQRATVAAALERWPCATSFRYTTDSQNQASVAVARGCGLGAAPFCGWAWARGAEERRQLGASLAESPPAASLLAGSAAVDALRRGARPYPEGCFVAKTWVAFDAERGAWPTDVQAREWPGAWAMLQDVTGVWAPERGILVVLHFAQGAHEPGALLRALAGELRQASAEGFDNVFFHFPMELNDAVAEHLAWQEPRGEWGPHRGRAEVWVLLVNGLRRAAELALADGAIAH